MPELPTLRTCLECGQDFEPEVDDQTTCSLVCQLTASCGGPEVR